MMTPTPKTARVIKMALAKIDKRIDAAYRANCCNIPIPMMEIPKIFALGRVEIGKGADDAALGATILAYVNVIRKDAP